MQSWNLCPELEGTPNSKYVFKIKSFNERCRLMTYYFVNTLPEMMDCAEAPMLISLCH